MSITAKELAKQLNLSEAAISMALNNKPGVSKPSDSNSKYFAKDFESVFIEEKWVFFKRVVIRSCRTSSHPVPFS